MKSIYLIRQTLIEAIENVEYTEPLNVSVLFFRLVIVFLKQRCFQEKESQEIKNKTERLMDFLVFINYFCMEIPGTKKITNSYIVNDGVQKGQKRELKKHLFSLFFMRKMILKIHCVLNRSQVLWQSGIMAMATTSSLFNSKEKPFNSHPI